MQIVTQFPHDITEQPDIGIILPDGTRLSARVWRPKGAEATPVPAILEYIPYRKRDGTIARDEIMHKYFAAHGYAVLRVDMRGSGDSEGVLADEYTPRELADGADVIAWIAAQGWCNGAVGMMGKSWGGFNALQVAALNPPALRAIITVCSTVDRFADDIHFKGGCLLNDNLAWGATMLSFSSRPPDPMLVGDAWRDMWLARLEVDRFLAADWLHHQRRDAYWKHGSISEDYSALRVPVLTVGGWADNYMNTVAHLVENLGQNAKGIVGPWIHQYPHQGEPAPAIGFLQEALRWWDRWLKALPTGADTDPAYRVWMQETARPARCRTARPGRWVAHQNWPSARQETRVFYLGQEGTLNPEGGPVSVAVNSPLDCGFGTGSYFPMSAKLPQMPGEQRDDDARSACFETPPLTADMEILGRPCVTLRLTSDKPRAQIAVRLCEVHPDGAATRITYGVLNLCHRDSHETPSDVPVGKAFDITLPLDQIAYRIKKGMRLRVAVSTVYWPFLWPAPERATLLISKGTLELPIHNGARTPEWHFDEAEGAAPWAHEVLRAPIYEATQCIDQSSGETVISILDDSGLQRDAEHGLITGSITRYDRRIHPDNPLSATAKTHWTQTLERGDWSVRTETYSRMWADADTYYLTARIEAFEGQTLIFERDFDQRIARDYG